MRRLGIGLATAAFRAGAGGASDVGGRPVAPAHQGFEHDGQLIRRGAAPCGGVSVGIRDGM